VLARKLELLKTDLRRWNEDAVGNIERKKKSFLERLCFLMSLKKKGPLVLKS
jgi:hypothetical protein